MKIITLLLFCSIYYTNFVYTQNNAIANQADTSMWYTNYELARSEAMAKNIPIMIVFSGSDWCKPCIMLRNEILNSQEFLSFAKNNLILVHADFPRQKKNRLSPEQTAKNEALAKKYNHTGQFPLVVLIRPDESVLGTTAYKNISPEEYILLIRSIIKK